MKQCFGHQVSSENIFLLLSELNAGSQKRIDDIFYSFIETLDESVKYNKPKSPQLLVSWGVYLSLILRYNPNTNLYYKNKHFLIVAFEAYKPYIMLYITYFLVTSTIAKTEIENPYKPGSASIIDYLIEQRQNNKDEKKLLRELKRCYTSSPNFYISRVGLKKQKQELAIFLDMPQILERELNEEDVDKCIYMHSNLILADFQNFTTDNFSRAISSLNLSIIKRTSHLSDYVKLPILDEFLRNCKTIQHALCYEILMIVITKNINLCKHNLKKIPQQWRSDVLKVYTMPRWKNYRIQEQRNATLNFYKYHLCYHEDKALIETLENLSLRLENEDKRKAFIENLITMNKSYFVLKVAGYSDFFNEKKTIFANTETLIGDNIFELSRDFVLPYREGERIYFFDYEQFPFLLEKQENPYNRNKLNESILSEIQELHDKYEKAGLFPYSISMSNFIKELVHGRNVLDDCLCCKNYRKKLAYVLRDFNVKEESFEWVNLDDIAVKFAMISLDFQAETIDDLCKKLYLASKDKKKSREELEQLKETIASLILVYSKTTGTFILNI